MLFLRRKMNKFKGKFIVLIVILAFATTFFNSFGLPMLPKSFSDKSFLQIDKSYAANPPENCKWELSTIDKNDAYIYCSGETGTTKNYQIVNNRPKGAPPIKFTISIPRSSDIKTITPSTFTLNPGEKKQLTITVKMPSCKGAKDYIKFDFPFTVTTDPSACSKSVKISLFCRGECPCCNYEFEKGFRGVMPATLKPGAKATTTIRISNTCDSKPMTLKVSGNSYTTITPGPLVTLQAKKSQLFTITFTMPSRLGGSCLQDTVNALYTIKPDGCNEYTKTFQIKCAGTADEKTNCNWELSRKDPINPPKIIYCSGETVTSSHYQIVNKRPNGTAPIQFKITFPKSSNIISVSPSTFSLKPGEKKGLEVKVKMPDCKGKPDYVKNDFPITVTTDPSVCSKSVNITFYCKDCTPCCNWTIEGNNFLKQLCPNQESKVTPKIFNKCNKTVTYKITTKDNLTVNGGKVAYLAVPANSSLSFTLVFKMPKCKGKQVTGPVGSEKTTPADVILIQYSIKPEFCTEKPYVHAVECKNCP